MAFDLRDRIRKQKASRVLRRRWVLSGRLLHGLVSYRGHGYLVTWCMAVCSLESAVCCFDKLADEKWY